MIRMNFPGDGTPFSGYRDACSWCLDAGISYGPLEEPNPCALWWGRANLAKWSKLAKGSLLDGKMTGDFRGGQVQIEISDPRKAKEVPPAAPLNQARGADLRRSADFLNNLEAAGQAELSELLDLIEAGKAGADQFARAEALSKWLFPPEPEDRPLTDEEEAFIDAAWERHNLKGGE